MSQAVQGVLNLFDTTDSGTPTAGTLDIYGQSVAGSMQLILDSPDNLAIPAQGHMGFNRFVMIGPNTAAAMSVFNTAVPTLFGTPSIPAIVSTRLLTSVRTTLFSTGASANTFAGIRSSVLEWLRGSVAGTGGFLYISRFGLTVLSTGMKAFIGIADITTAPPYVDPLTATGTAATAPGKFGMAISTNTGNWSFVNNVSNTTPTVVNLGANFPVDTTSLYELTIYSAPAGSSISYRVVNLSTGNSTSGSVSTNIPLQTQPLGFLTWIDNIAAANAAIAINQICIQTDH